MIHFSKYGVVSTHVQNKDAKLSLAIHTQFLSGSLNILLQLLDGVFEGGPSVIDLVDDQDILANQVFHLAQAGQVEPLCARDLGSGLLNDIVAIELFVEGETDSLDRDVGVTRLLEEGSQDTCGHVTTAADGDYELGLEVAENVGGGILA